MGALSTPLLLAGAAGVVATFVLAFSGDTPGAMRMAGIASTALILGMIIRRR